jgi:hypothetical protein
VGLSRQHLRAQPLRFSARLGTGRRPQLEGRLRRHARRGSGGHALLASRSQHRHGAR